MAEARYLYLMISHTDTGIGRVIRAFTRFPYNHAALTLDPTLRSWVAFGRYIHNQPLYCGFVREPVERYLAKGHSIPVRIYRFEVSEKKYQQLQQLFSLAGKPGSGLLYNFFELAAGIFGQTVPIPGAYTCLGFARTVLGKDYRSFRQLSDDLNPYLHYDGLLSSLVSDSGSRADIYFSDLDWRHATWRSAQQMAALSARAFHRGHPDIVVQRLH